MPLNLHPDCKKRIKESLIKALPLVKVTNKQFLQRETTLGLFVSNEALPKHGPITNALHSFIGEWPLYDFLYGSLAKELSDNQEFDSKNALLSLTDLDDYKDVDAIADRFIHSFDSLPWRYEFSLNIKAALLPYFSEVNEYVLSDNIRIIKANKEFIESKPITTPEGKEIKGLLGLGLFGGNIPKWDADSIYFQCLIDGYVGKYVSTHTTDNVLCVVKAFFGLAMANRLLKVKFAYHPATPKTNFIVFKQTDHSWKFEDKEELNDDISSTISDIILDDLDGKLDTDNKRAGWIKSCLDDVSFVLKQKEKSEKLMLAGQWYFESFIGRNELLSFVQTMVALEILLGDKTSTDLMGIGELLRNRCAYLIGKTHGQRQEVLEEFKNIYEIRSKIVHRGKSRLTSDERMLFRKLQWYCRRVIQEETELLKANG